MRVGMGQGVPRTIQGAKSTPNPQNQGKRIPTPNANPPHPPPPTIVQLASNSPLELSRAASLVAPFAAGVDLNCGCPQSWACSENLGASLCDKGPLVRDMIVATRERLRSDGWAMEMGEADKDSPKGRSVSVKIRIHSDLRYVYTPSCSSSPK